MWHGQHTLARVVGLVSLGLVCLPAAAAAQTAPMMTVQRTPNYTLVLDVGPVDAHDMGGSMMMNEMDMGMAANHHIDLRITQGDSEMAVMDVAPIIRFTDKATGQTRELPAMMGMHGMSMDMDQDDFHYGQNVFLPDGSYEVIVLLGPSDTALFQDVAVSL